MHAHADIQTDRQTDGSVSRYEPYLCWGDLSLSLFGPPERAAKKKKTNIFNAFSTTSDVNELLLLPSGALHCHSVDHLRQIFHFHACDVIFKGQQFTFRQRCKAVSARISGLNTPPPSPRHHYFLLVTRFPGIQVTPALCCWHWWIFNKSKGVRAYLKLLLIKPSHWLGKVELTSKLNNLQQAFSSHHI